MYKTGRLFEMTEDDPRFAALFATYPSSNLSLVGAIVDQVFILKNTYLHYKN